jgi:hypothetical protein
LTIYRQRGDLWNVISQINSQSHLFLRRTSFFHQKCYRIPIKAPKTPRKPLLFLDKTSFAENMALHVYYGVRKEEIDALRRSRKGLSLYPYVSV